MPDYTAGLDPSEMPQSAQQSPYTAGLAPNELPPQAKPPLKPAADTGKHISQWIDKHVGKPLVWAHNHPFEAFMAGAGSGMRGLEAAELGQDPREAFTHPGMQTQLKRDLYAGKGVALPGLMSLPGQVAGAIGAAERGPLAGDQLMHKLTRGMLDTAFDIGNDPYTYIPFGKLAEGVAAIPGVGKVGQAIAESKFGRAFAPEADLSKLTTAGKAHVEQAVNLGHQSQTVAFEDARAIVAKFADSIRKGVTPSELLRFFPGKAGDKKLAEIMGTKDPKKVLEATREEISAGTLSDVKKSLTKSGLLKAPAAAPKQPSLEQLLKASIKLAKGGKMPTTAQAMKAARDAMKTAKAAGPKMKDVQAFLRDPSQLKQVQEDVLRFITPSEVQHGPVMKLLNTLMHVGNRAFLSIPLPHGFNLTNLAYMRYGLPTTLKGIGNSIRIATNTVPGALAKDIDTLREFGTNSQYHKIFDELGINDILFAGKGKMADLANKAMAPLNVAVHAVNKGAVIPLERFSNALQTHFLNPLETGLRSAALKQEAKAGRTGAEAARSIHQAFGTDPASAVTKEVSGFAQPFAKFHFQTTPTQTIRTLLKNPQRIAALVKAQIDMNNQVNPHSAQFTPTTPAFTGVRAMMDLPYYVGGAGGALFHLGQSYSSLSQIEKGKVAEALSSALGRYIPASQAGAVIWRLATGQKSTAGESPISDVLPVVTGGYYSKWKP